MILNSINDQDTVQWFGLHLTFPCLLIFSSNG